MYFLDRALPKDGHVKMEIALNHKPRFTLCPHLRFPAVLGMTVTRKVFYNLSLLYYPIQYILKNEETIPRLCMSR